MSVPIPAGAVQSASYTIPPYPPFDPADLDGWRARLAAWCAELRRLSADASGWRRWYSEVRGPASAPIPAAQDYGTAPPEPRRQSRRERLRRWWLDLLEDDITDIALVAAQEVYRGTRS
jgi:hypothetical protein